MDHYADEELAAMEDGLLAEYAQREQAQLAANARTEQQAAMMLAPPPPVPLYDPAQVPVLGYPGMGTNGGAAEPTEPGIMGFLKRRWGPLPTWAWLLVGGGVAGGGYWYWKKSQGAPTKNGSGGDEDEPPKIGQRMPVLSNGDGDHEEAGGGWAPSRSSFAAKLQGYFDKKGLAPHVVVWHDAEDARDKGKMRVLSPLVNVQVKDAKTVKVDTALQRWARREGLDPRTHQDGSIGFYPHTGKRGKAWESYIDDLRDDGQSV